MPLHPGSWFVSILLGQFETLCVNHVLSFLGSACYYDRVTFFVKSTIEVSRFGFAKVNCCQVV